ncbi:helix-turn-helix domain-containing protein [Bacillus cereus]|uniref:helix-turn-helix domain-containing protein n=1 Tax=Bacillus cereus TaxID=1396 RepID=UPI003D647589
MKEKAYQSKPLLTKREREVFELLVQDKTTKEIAGELFISEKTVRNHISNVMCSLCKHIGDRNLMRLLNNDLK